MERLLALLELTTDFVSSASPRGEISFLNRNGAKLLGLAPDVDVTTLRIPDLHPPWATRLIVEEGLPAAMAKTSWSAVTALLHRDGTEIPVSQVIVAHRDPDSGEVTHLSTIMRDIRERMATEQELREQTAMFRLVLDNIPHSVFWKDRDSVYRGANRNFARLAGFDSVDDLVGKSDHELGLPPGRAEFYRELDARLMTTGEPQYHWVETTVVEGGRKVWLDTHKIPLHDGRGEVVGLLGMMEDITERRAADAQLQQVRKLESMGQLAGGVAHDFNNMLTAISGAAELLAEDLADDSEQSELANIILQAAENASALTQRLLEFSRKGAHSRQPVDVHAVVDTALALLGRSIDKRISFRKALDAEVSTLLGDPSQLQNMLLNLAFNARDAMPEGGELSVRSASVQLEADDPRAGAFSVRPGPYVALTVTDTGAGMSEELADRVFEPFFTTKDPGAGTGLGLSAVYGAVVDHGGAIALTTAPGEGTSFTIYLPVDAELRLATRDATTPSKSTPRGRVLLVDDEPLVRNVGRAMITSLGYEVTLAEDGQTALELFRADASRYSVVLLDMVMPGLSGRETLEALRELDPDVKVVFCSGFTRERVKVEDERVCGFLKKPYRIADLAQQLAAAADESDAYQT